MRGVADVGLAQGNSFTFSKTMALTITKTGEDGNSLTLCSSNVSRPMWRVAIMLRTNLM